MKNANVSTLRSGTGYCWLYCGAHLGTLTQCLIHPSAPDLLTKDSPRNEINFDFQPPFSLHISNSSWPPYHTANLVKQKNGQLRSILNTQLKILKEIREQTKLMTTLCRIYDKAGKILVRTSAKVGCKRKRIVNTIQFACFET